MAPDGRLVNDDQLNNDRAELERLRAMAAQMFQWRQQLPTMLPPHFGSHQLPSLDPRLNRISAGNHWGRRRGRATSEFRRDIYTRNLYVDPESISDITGRFRESSPAWYRTNPAQTHRLVPWLNRELNVLLENSPHQSNTVTQRILNLIERFEIRSADFHDRLLPYLGTHTDHFQHEFYHYARSVYDMIGYDRSATYTDQPNPGRGPTRQDSSSSEDDIMVVEEVRPHLSQPVSPPDTLPEAPEPPALGEVQPSTSDLLNMGPSTSTGICASSTPLQRLVIPASDSSDDEIQAAFRNEAKDDVVEIVGEVKPRHLRTPEVIDISSAGENDLEQKNNISEPIEISSTESEVEVPNEEERKSKEEMENLRKILEDRSTKQRILSYLKSLQEEETAENQGDNSTTNTESAVENGDRKNKGKGKGKGKNRQSLLTVESTNDERPLDLSIHSNSSSSKKKKKSKKRKKKKIEIDPVGLSSSSDENEDKPSTSSIHKKTHHRKSKKKEKKKSKKHKKKSSKSKPLPPTDLDESNSTPTESEEEQPLSKWKVNKSPNQIKTNKKRSKKRKHEESNDSSCSEHSDANFKIVISRKRQKRANQPIFSDSSKESDNDDVKPPKLKSVVCLPPPSID